MSGASEPALRLAEVLEAAMDAQGGWPRDARARQVCAHICRCRTPAMGGVHERCTQCGHERTRYHSCRDRHCPQCQGAAMYRWAERQRNHALPAPHHHIVFTVPDALNEWVSRAPRAVYAQLFASAWATLSAFFAQHRRTRGRGAMTAVLHTWGQTLTRHVHLHCLVPAGVLDADKRWHTLSGEYLFPVRALSRRFRGHFVAGLRERLCEGELNEPGAETLLERLMASEWVLYAKPCAAHTERVIEYLARYTYRIGLSETRLRRAPAQGPHAGRVGLRYLDYRSGREQRTAWLTPRELMRRFTLHVLPKGFMRVRHYGLLANCCRQRLRAHIDGQAHGTDTAPARGVEASEPAPTPQPLPPCPRCDTNALHVAYRLAPRVDSATRPARMRSR